MEIENLYCTYEGVNNYAQHGFSSKCEFVSKYCVDHEAFFDNVDIYYCKFHESIGLMLLYAIPYIIFCFYWLSSTADSYLEPSVAKLAKYLRFSEALAGITLIALANGMPDVISCYVASEQETVAGIQLSLGALFGASIFATTIILARVLLNSDYLQLNRNALLRDLGFYIVTNIFLLVIGGLGGLNIYYAIALYGIYFLFVVFAIVEEYKIRKDDPQSNSDFPKEIEFTSPNNPADLEKRLALTDSQNNPKFQHQGVSGRRDSYSLAHLNEPSGKVWRIIETPFNFVRDITIPYVDDSKYQKYRMAGYPIFTTAFLLWQLGLIVDIRLSGYWIAFAVGCIFCSIVLFKIGDSPRYRNTLTVLTVFVGFVISVFWLHIVAELLIDFLNVLKIASGYSMNLIGLTILAWGNSSNDFFVDVALAKRGYGIMAVSGIFAGQFFNLNIGFGIVMIKKIFKDGSINLNFFDGDKDNTINYLLIIFSVGSLVTTLAYAVWKNYNLSRKYAYFLFGYYAVFFACMIFLS